MRARVGLCVFEEGRGRDRRWWRMGRPYANVFPEPYMTLKGTC